MGVLETERLILRRYEYSDVPELVRLIGTEEVAATTLRIPYPYTEADAREFVASMQGDEESRFAIVIREGHKLCGGIGLRLNREHDRAELGYWIGVPYWGQGYATEASRAMLEHGFRTLGLHRIFAHHFRNNPASGKVLQKLGMQHEGCLRGHVKKWGQVIDVEVYGLLREKWDAANNSTPR